MAGCQLYSVSASTGEISAQPKKARQVSSPAQDGPQLAIDTVSLPGTYPRATYLVRMQARGGTVPYHWRVEKGDLPPGLKLEDDGALLRG
jgi:hypothetical protein